jgi:predicted dehydrogenase
MKKQVQTRRDFLRNAAIGTAGAMLGALTATSRAEAPSANDRIRIGVIGCGSRATGALMREALQFVEECNVELAAVCDLWKQHREQAAAMVKKATGVEPKQIMYYQELLSQKDIDAVIIATPDHQHARMLADAARAGKDAYIEKPMAMNMGELIEAVDAVKANNRIVQVGTQLRSWPSFTGCKKFVETGALGKVSKTSQVRNGYEPYWLGYVRPLGESDTDWKAFLMGKPDRPWDARQYSAWYGYRDFSSGPVGGFMSHFIDLVHYIMGAKFPHSAVTLGGVYVYKDNWTCPDTVHTLLDYPEDFMVSYSTSFGNGSGNYTKFFGTLGVLDATDWNEPVVSGEGSNHPNRIKEKKPVPHVEMPHHMKDFLTCIRTRKQPNANIDAGYQHAVACILSDTAYAEGRRMVYDAEKRQIRPG